MPMCLAVYWEEGYGPDEVKKNLERVFPGAVFLPERSRLALELSTSKVPALVREEIQEVEGVVRVDWLE